MPKYRPSIPQKGGQMGMMQEIQKLQEQLVQTQEQLAQETVEYSAGGGAIKVVMTGDQRCQSVVIDPQLVADGAAEMVQDLVLAAVNGALDASRALASERRGPLAGGVPF